MNGGQRTRRGVVIIVMALCATLLTGCLGVSPHGVAQHEAKRDYHLAAGNALIESDLMTGLNGLGDFTAVGYMHGVAGSDELHVQNESSVIGGTIVSRESSDDAAYTIDMVHIEGSGMTYHLFGEGYLPVTRTPWVATPGQDAQRQGVQLCHDVSAVWFVCEIVQAWIHAQEVHAASLPFHQEMSADGSRHYVTALTPNSLEQAGLFDFDEDLRARLGEEVLESFMPLHIWMDQDGVVSKIETSASLQAEQDLLLELQFGFELTGVPGEDDAPIDPATLDPGVITTMTDPVQVERLWEQIGAIRKQDS